MGVGICHGDVAASEQHGDFPGVDLIVFGLAAVAGLQVQCMGQDKGDVMRPAEIRDPVPAEHAFHTDHEVIQIRGR